MVFLWPEARNALEVTVLLFGSSLLVWWIFDSKVTRFEEGRTPWEVAELWVKIIAKFIKY